MPPTQKPIRFSGHARERLSRRGATEQEVTDTIQTEAWQLAERGRLECRKNYAFHAEWNGKYYTTKQIRPVFVDEPNEIVVVTLYVYYF